MEYTPKRDDKPSILGVPYFHMNIIGENYIKLLDQKKQQPTGQQGPGLPRNQGFSHGIKHVGMFGPPTAHGTRGSSTIDRFPSLPLLIVIVDLRCKSHEIHECFL